MMREARDTEAADDTVAWAHLSDFHFKTDQDYGADEVLQALLRDLEMFAGQADPARGAEPVPLDFIVVTGDVAHSGRREQYDVARRVLGELAQAAGVPEDCIFLVPGNHDVDRERDVTSFMSVTGRPAFEKLWANLAVRRSIGSEKLAAYRAFAGDLNPRIHIPAEQPGGFACRLECRGGRTVALLGLSSAWLSGSDGEQGRLITGKEQAYDLGGGVTFPALADADLKLVLLHHPLEWMQEFDRSELKKLLAEHADLVLRGHLHETGLELVVSPGRVLRTVAAGSAYAGSRYRNAYNIARVSFGAQRTVQLWLRAYAAGERSFVQDNETYAHAEHGTWTWDLGGAAGRPELPGPKPRRTAAADPRPYLVKLREQNRWLDVRGIGIRASERVELERVYTRLRVTPPGEPRGPAGDLKGRLRRDALEHALERAADRDVELHQLLPEHRRLVLVGDPGAGKTTFLRFVALNLSRALLGDEPEQSLKRTGLPADGAPPLPVFVRLGAFGQFLSGNPEARYADESAEHFYRYLDFLCRSLDAGLPEPFLRERVRAGGCVLLLDGLDEVPGQELRARVGQILDEVVSAPHAAGNRHVVTCRTRHYQGKAQLGGGFMRAELVDFGPDEIQTFVHEWSRALHRVPRGEERSAAADTAAAYSRELSEAIRAHPHVRPLTTNPLLLTILTVVHWNRKKLPEQRADLYEDAVEYLLAAREKHSAYPGTLRKDCLEAVALRLFADRAGVRKTLGRAEAAAAVHPLLGVDQADAEAFIEDEELYSGILVSRIEGEVEFWHPTFGEYLAALGLAGEPNYWERVRERLFDEGWNEVVLLLAGCLRRGGLRQASAFIAKILAMDATLPQLARQVGLVGRILRDILPAGGDPAAGTGYAEARERVLAIFEKTSDVPENVRVEVGEALGQAGDPRIPDADHANRVFLEGGTFWMGAQDKDRKKPGYDPDAYGDEAPVHRVTVSGFWIDRYPVTVAQYRRFVEAAGEGYLDARFWRPEGWRWREAKKWTGPREWEEQLRHLNRPVTYVSWYEANAYCAWLSATSKRRMSLPTEAQWEYAARGAEARTFPWGSDEPSDRHANFGMRIGRPTPVGIYPLGATPEGVQDLSGNVLEWCLDWWADKYPSQEQTDPAGPREGGYRLLRGGAFDDGARNCRGASRSNYLPGYGSGGVGFRCVVLGREDSND